MELTRRAVWEKLGKNIYIVHKLLANWSNFVGECGGEHHNLLVVGGHFEDLLDVSSHVCSRIKVEYHLFAIEAQNNTEGYQVTQAFCRTHRERSVSIVLSLESSPQLMQEYAQEYL